jgi:hypothetical protein
MRKIVAAVAFAAVIASPAFAQSFDPSVGSGNIAAQVTGHSALSAFAQELRTPLASGKTSNGVRPFTAEEKALFDRIPME